MDRPVVRHDALSGLIDLRNFSSRTPGQAIRTNAEAFSGLASLRNFSSYALG
jgi:hypothetical protein